MLKDLSYGDKGQEVKLLQKLLNSSGYSCGSADCIFGSKTIQAVMALQKATNLAVTGVVKMDTWEKLFNL